MRSRFRTLTQGILLAAALLLAGASGVRAEYEVIAQTNVEYANHDGVKLIADLYQPKGLEKAPAIVAVHGGSWQAGSRAGYRYWGPYLAKNGYVVLAIDYRLGPAGAYPLSVYDVKAAIQFVRAKAATLGVDPDRIGLMGDSAGSHLASLVALAGDEPQFSAKYQDDPNAKTPVGVKTVVTFYGVYDMLAQWEHDQLYQPMRNIAQQYLGASPQQNRRIYFESSPLSYTTVEKNHSRFLLIHGLNDDVVDPISQSKAFQTALNQAGIYVRRIVIPGAGHFWSSDPFEDDPQSYGAQTAPRLMRFLRDGL